MDYSTIKNYSMLLKTMVENGKIFSTGSTVVKILKLCQKSSDREQISKEIITIINESETEKEVIEKLNSLS